MSQASIEDLQVRIAHQEVAIEALDATVARQDQLIRELSDEIAEIRRRLAVLTPSPLGGDPADEPPPPHY